MSLSFPSRSWAFILSSLAIFGLVVADWANAQGGATQLGNSAAIERDFKGVKGRLLEAVGSGKNITPDILDTAAKYYVYRVTWPAYLDAKPEPGRVEPLALVVKDFHDHIAKVKAGDPAFANAYIPVLVDRLRELTDLPVVDNARALANGIQMLPGLGKLQGEKINSDKISKYLVELLNPKTGKHDLIKLGALRALREFPPVDSWGGDIDPSLLQDKFKLARKAGELERIEALTAFILRPVPEKASPMEIDAYRYLRREALETLAQAGAPAVAAITGKKFSVEGPIAPILVRALIPGGMTPETTLAEKNEAALGLCAMSVPSTYDPAPAYHFVGKTIVELGKEYSADWAQLGNKSYPSRLPWKITAKRWEGALKQLSEKTKNAPPADKAKADTLDKAARGLIGAWLKSENINANVIERDLLKIAAPPEKFLMFRPTVNSEPITWKLPTAE